MQNDNRCLFLKKLPLELRDRVYDYVAVSEKKVGLHLTLSGQPEPPKTRAYAIKGLSHTCKQTRQEYSLRLQQRIKNLLTETYTEQYVTLAQLLAMNRRERRGKPPRSTLDWRSVSVLEKCPRRTTIRVAERKVSKGVHVLDDIAVSMRIPFAGIDDISIKMSSLTLTVASHEARAYNKKYIYQERGDYYRANFWEQKGEWPMIEAAASTYFDLVRYTNWTDHEHWFALDWKYDVIHTPREKSKWQCPVDRLWMERLGCCMGDEDDEG